MVWMALDHPRDFCTNIPFEPENIDLTWPGLFFTRWITHFCAPMFFLLACTGALLYRQRTGSVAKVSRFLWTRGIWLVVLEWTIIEFAWTFVPWTFGGVMWSLGVSMVILAGLMWLPEWAILTTSELPWRVFERILLVLAGHAKVKYAKDAYFSR
jgi:uncharacterized membrane protein